MTDISKARRPSVKHIFNLGFFLASILVVVAVWPPEKCETWSELLGSILIVSSCYLMLYLFLSHFRPEILEVTRKTIFIILIILIFIVITRIVISFANPEILFLIPFSIIPIVICTFYDARLALFILVITLILAGFIVPASFEFVFISFISGVSAIFVLTNIYKRAKIVYSSLSVVASYSVIYFALSIMNGSAVSGANFADYKLFLGNGILILLSYPLIFLFERKFYFLSDTTLLELSNLDNPLLRRFAEEAPGSFQHSLQVANLAEEAARIVGANPLLVRTGSLYHDIGKIINSGFFIENQKNGDNPHRNIDPVESSEIIINHVNEGVLLARKYKLPVQIIDFIRTHHGTKKAYFFYMKYLETEKSSTAAESKFSYPGPKPFTRETVIVMMADAVEAASRTLEKFNEQTIGELIEKIISIQEQDDQFADAPVTFRDLTEVKSIFRKRLLNIHHTRTVYPEKYSGDS
ncbi:MAG: HDIG domain-containing protein [Bacteroidales bacterium]|nr:HDIG domain-containing protein [Bacteroidales bacterium]